MQKRARVFVATLASALWLCSAAAAAAPVTLERTVVRFSAPELGGPRSPRFVLERVLAFETRLHALEEGALASETEPYAERHVRAALERHIAETLLASLPIEPEPTRLELSQQTERARDMLTEAVGGAAALEAAAQSEGVTAHVLFGILRRKARASFYLDRMVLPMLNPTEAELRALYGSGRSPFRGLPFEQVAAPLSRWYVGRRLSDALSRFFQGARTRLTITVLETSK